MDEHRFTALCTIATLTTIWIIASCTPGSSTQAENVWNKPDDEQYGQGVEEDTEIEEDGGEGSVKENLSSLPQELVDRMILEFTVVETGVTQQLQIEQATVGLFRYPDWTIALSVGAFGVLDSGTDGDSTWTTYAGCNFFVPWDVENPPETPYSWVHETSHLTAEPHDIRSSATDSGPTIYTEIYTGDDPEPEIVSIYPNPVYEDPHHVEISGETVFEEVTGIDWETEMTVIGHSHLLVEDHIGTVVEVDYHVEPLADAGDG